MGKDRLDTLAIQHELGFRSSVRVLTFVHMCRGHLSLNAMATDLVMLSNQSRRGLLQCSIAIED